MGASISESGVKGMRGEAAKKALKLFLRQPTDDYDLGISATVMKESDRASVVIQTSLTEDELRRALQRRMSHLTATEKAALFDYTKPLGSFSGLIDIAYAMNVITRADRDDLHIIREMRNACAHAPRDISFETPEMQQAVAALSSPILEWVEMDLKNPALARSAFQMTSCAFILRCRHGEEGGTAKLRTIFAEAVGERRT